MSRLAFVMMAATIGIGLVARWTVRSFDRIHQLA